MKPIKNRLDELKLLRNASLNAQDMAIDTAAIGYSKERGRERKAEARDAKRSLVDHWKNALKTSNTILEAVAHLEEASNVAREWGDNSYERRAIDILEEEAEKMQEAAERPA